MDIPQELPQFRNEMALIVIASPHGVHFLQAWGEKLEKIGEFKVENPTYTDDEGQFGGGSAQGSVKEIDKKEIHDKFMNQLESSSEDLRGMTWNEWYLFAPAIIREDVKSLISKKIGLDPKLTFDGNYINEPDHLRFLKMIQEKVDEFKDNTAMMSDEARKLMNK